MEHPRINTHTESTPSHKIIAGFEMAKFMFFSLIVPFILMNLYNCLIGRCASRLHEFLAPIKIITVGSFIFGLFWGLLVIYIHRDDACYVTLKVWPRSIRARTATPGPALLATDKFSYKSEIYIYKSVVFVIFKNVSSKENCHKVNVVSHLKFIHLIITPRIPRNFVGISLDSEVFKALRRVDPT